jgi:hypothetical protein
MSVYVLENINEVIDENIGCVSVKVNSSICLVNIDQSGVVTTGLDTLIGEEQQPTNYPRLGGEVRGY